MSYIQELRCVVRCSPERITAARAGAFAESIASKDWKTSVSLEDSSALAAPLSTLEVRSFSSFSSPSRMTSASRTDYKAGVSSPMTSCSTWRTVTWLGILNWPELIILKTVDFPRPFRPTKPYLGYFYQLGLLRQDFMYLLPYISVTSAPLIRTFSP